MQTHNAKEQPHLMTKSHDQLDLLHGSLWKTVPLFAMPVAATSILEQLSNFIGTLMIGHFSPDGGSIGMAAVGSNLPLTSLIIQFFVGISLGANVVIAYAVGSKDEYQASRCAHSAIALSLIGVVVAVVMEVFSQPILQCLGVPADAFEDALLFLRIYLIGIPAILLYDFEAAVFRGIGITRMPLVALAVSAVLNAVLDIIFVPVLGWGVAGVALAMVIGYSASAVFLFVRLLKATGPIRIDRSRLRIDRESAKSIVRIGLPAGIQGAVFAVANIVIQTCINSLGTQVMAATSASLALEFVCYSLLNSFSQACTTFVGQSRGAGDFDRCKQTLKACMIEDIALALIVIAFMIWQGRAVMLLFSADPEVIALGYMRICIVFPTYIFSMAYENMSGYLRGFGISLPPSILTVIGVCGVRLLWVALVFPAYPTYISVLFAYPLSLGVTALLMVGALAFFRPATTALKTKDAFKAN